MRSRLMMKRGMLFTETVSAVTAQKGPVMELNFSDSFRAHEAASETEGV